MRYAAAAITVLFEPHTSVVAEERRLGVDPAGQEVTEDATLQVTGDGW